MDQLRKGAIVWVPAPLRVERWGNGRTATRCFITEAIVVVRGTVETGPDQAGVYCIRVAQDHVVFARRHELVRVNDSEGINLPPEAVAIAINLETRLTDPHRRTA